MKKVTLLLVLLITILLLAGCSNGNEPDRRMITTAKIRYLDGSCDTLILERWYASQSGTVTLFTDEGRKVVIGANNVIIIEETEAQYEN